MFLPSSTAVVVVIVVVAAAAAVDGVSLSCTLHFRSSCDILAQIPLNKWQLLWETVKCLNLCLIEKTVIKCFTDVLQMVYVPF